MTMIISAHVGDCVLIAADNRTMKYNLKTESMSINTNNEQKIKLWCKGAIASSGETGFCERVENYFINFKENDNQLRQMDAIYNEIEKRILEGVPKKILLNNVAIFSMFDGSKTLLYSIPIEPFFQYFEKNGIATIRPYMHEITDWTVDVSCFNIPPDMSTLQNFQKNLKALSDFNNEHEFFTYYIEQLKIIFTTHASTDPSITASFDLYFQAYHTGHSCFIHIPNYALPPSNAAK